MSRYLPKDQIEKSDKLRSYIKKGAIGVGLGVLITWVALALMVYFADPIMDAAGNFLLTEDEVNKSDIIFVPSGSPRIRFQKAIELLKEDAAERVLLNLEKQSADDKVFLERYSDRFSTTQLLKHMMVVDGISEDAVTISTRRAKSTEEDFEILREAINSNGIASVIVVTSWFHLRRCRLIAGKIIDSKTQLFFVSADSPTEDYFVSQPKRALALFISYLKLGYYYLTVI